MAVGRAHRAAQAEVPVAATVSCRAVGQVEKVSSQAAELGAHRPPLARPAAACRLERAEGPRLVWCRHGTGTREPPPPPSATSGGLPRTSHPRRSRGHTHERGALRVSRCRELRRPLRLPPPLPRTRRLARPTPARQSTRTSRMGPGLGSLPAPAAAPLVGTKRPSSGSGGGGCGGSDRLRVHLLRQLPRGTSRAISSHV